MTEPSIGRSVHFRLSANQANEINQRRTKEPHKGNSVHEGQILPMIVTQVWPREYEGNAHLAHHEGAPLHEDGCLYDSTTGVNGQVLLDGCDSLWVTSAPQHSTLPGCWFWPARS